MALNKTPVLINFAQGLDTKSDDKQVQIGKFLALQNSVFDKQGRLTKRNGYPQLTSLPDSEQTTLTTLNDNLLATGSNLYAYSADDDKWLNRGSIQPVALDVSPLVRVSTSQSSPDTAVSDSGFVCLVYVDTAVAYYQVSDSKTGQQVVSRTTLPSTASNPRVFLLGRYFIITYLVTISATTHLQYIAIPTANVSSPRTPTDIATNANSLAAGYDGFVANNNLYISWAATGTTVKTNYLTSTLLLGAPVSIAAHTATLISVTADTSASTAVIWVTYFDSGTTNGYTAAYDQNLNVVLVSTQIITTTAINEITSVAVNQVLTVLYENNNNYNSTGAYPSAVKTDFITEKTVTQTGTVSGGTIILRSVGLASKAFIDPETGAIYVIAAYGEANQPTYFLIDSTGFIIMRLAYSNGGGYEASQVLPTVSSLDGQYLAPYLIKDFLTTVNKGTDNPAGTPVNAIYTQTGVNLAKFSINTSGQHSSEIASALHLTGGQLWEYDGVRPVEHGFQVYPENIAISSIASGGDIGVGNYYYQFCYEWTDNQGMLHRSAPSIPIVVNITMASSTNTLYVPTLRLTDKISPNPVRIVGYRWSNNQPVYYQFTSVTSPITNDTTIDYVTIVDTLSDAVILGNAILYTTGGVIENIAAPANMVSVLFKNRLFLVDAEDRNLLWFSKQVIEGTPVEMSDLLTLYVAPTTGSQGSTGGTTALGAMDDKLIIFKENAIYYVTGTGPDNTGANNDFSDPVFITSSVGCANQDSIVLMPAGLMFQSNKGIWLLGRDLSTQYIGAPVEQYNSQIIKSSTVVPGTNQVRFILDDGVTLMYDYYYSQWGTFSNLSAISATLYNGLHTYLNAFGQIFQEKENTYLDGSSPVLLSFTTAWINIAGLQGYERFYFLYLLGTYFTPFKLNVQMAYDYNASATQAVLVQPDNYTGAYGSEPVYGGGPNYGGPGNVFSARVFPENQKCESFQIIINEVFDSSFGTVAGQGLTLSGLDLVVGVKKGYRVQSARKSFG